MPQGSDLDRNALLNQPLMHLSQRETRLQRDPASQRRFKLLKLRSTMSANLKTPSLSCLLESIAHLIDPHTADFKTTRYFRRPVSTIQSPQNPVPQILRVSLHPQPPPKKANAVSHNMYTLELEML